MNSCLNVPDWETSSVGTSPSPQARYTPGSSSATGEVPWVQEPRLRPLLHTWWGWKQHSNRGSLWQPPPLSSPLQHRCTTSASGFRASFSSATAVFCNPVVQFPHVVAYFLLPAWALDSSKTRDWLLWQKCRTSVAEPVTERNYQSRIHSTSLESNITVRMLPSHRSKSTHLSSFTRADTSPLHPDSFIIYSLPKAGIDTHGKEEHPDL